MVVNYGAYLQRVEDGAGDEQVFPAGFNLPLQNHFFAIVEANRGTTS